MNLSRAQTSNGPYQDKNGDHHLCEVTELGERLRAIRQLRRKTLKEVSSAAEISESFLSQLERGRTNATIATLQRLSTALGIEVSDLFSTNAS